MENNETKTVELITNKLIAFIDEMNKWELKNKEIRAEVWSKENPTDEDVKKSREVIRNGLEAIFSKYCTERELKRKYGRMASLDCCTPPEYAVDTQPIQEIEQVNKNKYRIYTNQLDGFKLKFRYTLIFKKGEWRLDKKEWFGEEKWENSSF
ncbi:NTF2 fold immunity protein [Pasteurella atlantica]|uniref:NTF2 fold immunity protein n=1 Tax=Pasteurellaceae TaxID=712 RepID=UPI00276C08C5|nr:NTF2 fold immunity protein [Pasteurella atlantica]MDP8033965.1 NTF2 fold immunity protein [Pasteurella atlantica]MDP8035838.1 NTF2 fold immunity protein [Pasteurella atlantica]MDP8037849.1 NTF2 fold immunity protein [Pasteurella atlantica]MDP8048175.1 NTF2 fold immunity protein [Pasteurella atlantica]MDP8050135.1 NTF2 fold immunity protein [Pasteurella atlantica]